MMFLSIFIFLFSGILSTYGCIKLTPCKLPDQECFKTMLNSFLAQTYKGIPEHDVIPMDPLYIPSLNIGLKDRNNTKLHFKDITITGLKKEELQDFDVDEKDGVAMFLIKTNQKLKANLTVDYTKLSKSFNGIITMNGSTLIDAVSDFEFKADDKGIEHIIYGPERIACETLGKMEVTLTSGLVGAIEQDESLYEREVRNVFCKIVETGWSTVMHNIRVAARVMAKSEILIDS